MTTLTTTQTPAIKHPTTRDEARDLLEREDIKIFENIDFLGADIESYTIKDRYFKNCDFSDAYMEDANFINCTFIDCDFTDALMAEVDIAHTTLTGCNFSEADFSNAALNHAVFTKCDFTDTNLSGGVAAYTTFKKAKITNTDFTDFDLAGVTFDKTPLNGALCTAGTYYTLCEGEVALVATSRGWHMSLYTKKNSRFIRAKDVESILRNKEKLHFLGNLWSFEEWVAHYLEVDEKHGFSEAYADILGCIQDNSNIITELWGDITPIKSLQEDPTESPSFYQFVELLYEPSKEPIEGLALDFRGRGSLTGARISGKHFRNCDFSWVGLCSAVIEDCEFEDCDLSYAYFDNARIESTRFTWANLSRADFPGAQLKNSVFCCVKCEDTYLGEVDLAEVNLCDSLAGAKFEPGTYHTLNKSEVTLIATSKDWRLFHVLSKYPISIAPEDIEAIIKNTPQTEKLMRLEEAIDHWLKERGAEDIKVTYQDIVQCIKDNSHIITELWGDITPIKCLQKKPADHLTRKINDTTAQLAA